MKILTQDQADVITRETTNRLIYYLQTNNINTIVLGISGGIDSAAVAAISLLAIKDLHKRGLDVKYDFVFLDVDSDCHDLLKAEDLEKTLGFRLRAIDLTPWYNTSPLINTTPADHPRRKIALGNIKCRLRMITLYHLAQLSSGVVMNTDDLSERYMGFWTRHGDEGDVKIIQELTKDEVYDLSEYLGVPKSVLNSLPGDGLGVTTNNHASDQLGLPYIVIDYIISRFIQNGFNTEGSFDQISSREFIDLTNRVSEELDCNNDAVVNILKQALKTGFKRRYGENIADLVPDRTEVKLPEIGTNEFNDLYLKAIRNQK